MIYTYKCHKCGHKFEQELKVDYRYEPTLKVCIRCGEYAVKKEVDAANFKVNGYSEKNGYSKKT
jgi:putative FmdB family regulatory protein